MVYDPVWGMPKINWVQQGSFEGGEVPPASDPDAGTLVCLPAINQDWLPFIQGCLDQMRNPSSWIVADDDAMYAVLSRVDRLKQMIGERAACAMYQMRFTDACLLQFSTDAGATWSDVDGWPVNFPVCNPPQTGLRLTSDCQLQLSFDQDVTFSEVPGWAEYWKGCVQSAVPVIGLPPNPGDQTPDQLACSIAAYLATNVVQDAIQAAVTNISSDLTLLQFGATVLNVIPEFVLVRFAFDAFAIIYADISEGTLSDYSAALTDAGLWTAVVCAIYTAIEPDGMVDPANFAAIVANLSAISYTHPGVVTTIAAYVSALGDTGLAQLSQRAGLEVGADCSTCGSFCREWNFAASDAGWGQTPGDANGVWTNNGGATGNRWQAGANIGAFALDIETSQYAGKTTSFRLVGENYGDVPGFAPYRFIADPTTSDTWAVTLPSTGAFDVTVDVGGHVFTAGFRYVNWTATIGNDITQIYANTTGSAASGNGMGACVG